MKYKKSLWTFAFLCGIVLYCKGGADMAQISIAEIYSGEKYGVMSAAIADYMSNGQPSEYDERTWVDMLLVKHALIAADKIRQEGDTVSGMTDDVASSSYVRWDDDNA